MEEVLAPFSVRRQFRRRLLGYSRRDVDTYVADVVAANTAIRDEFERRRVAGDPLANAGAEVAGILRLFAETVASAQQRSQEEASRLRDEAERVLDEARASAEELVRSATTEADERLGDAFRAACIRFVELRDQRDAAERAITSAVDALQTALSSLHAVPVVPPAFAPELLSSH